METIKKRKNYYLSHVLTHDTVQSSLTYNDEKRSNGRKKKILVAEDTGMDRNYLRGTTLQIHER